MTKESQNKKYQNRKSQTNKSQNNKNQTSGFTLVELMVVLVILGILAAFLVPALTGYIDSSHKKACHVNMEDVKRYYLAYTGAEGYKVKDKDAADAILEQTMSDSGGTWLDEKTATTTSFTGDCGNKITVTYSEDYSCIVDISCEKHGNIVDDTDSDTNDGTTLVSATNGIQSLADCTVVLNYLKLKLPNTSSTIGLDSQGKNFAPEVKALLQQMGYDVEHIGWRVFAKGDGTCDIYWTNVNLDSVSPGTQVPYIHSYYYYDKAKNTITKTDKASTTGMCNVTSKTVEGKTFNVLDPGNTKKLTVDTNYGDSWK